MQKVTTNQFVGTKSKSKIKMFSPYPSTEQFRNVIKRIKGVKEDAENRYQDLPTLNFVGTVKLHGSNAAIGYQKDTGHWCQSRNNVITPTKDFEAFAKTLDPIANQFLLEVVLPQCPVIREFYELGRKIVIFGEWCGGKIQKNVAIYGLPKMFVIFNVRISDIDSETDETKEYVDDDEQPKSAFWLHPKDWSNIRWHERSIYNIHDFPKYEMDINFECPELSQNKLIEITEFVENQCPVGKHFNRTGLGEGVVWTEWEKSNGSYAFKVKGAKHSVTNVTTLAAVDTEKCENLQNFIGYACTENRMQQGLDYMREQNVTIEMKNFAIFIKWIVGDIVKEEKDTMDASNINSTDVGRSVRNKVLPWFRQQIT